jgi:hypothetical protein
MRNIDSLSVEKVMREILMAARREFDLVTEGLTTKGESVARLEADLVKLFQWVPLSQRRCNSCGARILVGPPRPPKGMTAPRVQDIRYACTCDGSEPITNPAEWKPYEDPAEGLLDP